MYCLGYGLDSRTVLSWILEGLSDFSLFQSIQKKYGVHTASHLKITGGLYPRRRTDHSLNVIITIL